MNPFTTVQRIVVGQVEQDALVNVQVNDRSAHRSGESTNQVGALVRHLAVGRFRVVGPPYDVNGDRVLVKVLNQAASTAAAPFPSAG